MVSQEVRDWFAVIVSADAKSRLSGQADELSPADDMPRHGNSRKIGQAFSRHCDGPEDDAYGATI